MTPSAISAWDRGRKLAGIICLFAGLLQATSAAAAPTAERAHAVGVDAYTYLYPWSPWT